jgi:hypothetical protein
VGRICWALLLLLGLDLRPFWLSSLQVASLVLNLLLVLLAVALAFLAFKRTGGGSSVTLSLGKSPNSRYEVGGLHSGCLPQ